MNMQPCAWLLGAIRPTRDSSREELHLVLEKRELRSEDDRVAPSQVSCCFGVAGIVVPRLCVHATLQF